MVERHLAKVNVASSNLVFRSKQNDLHLQVVLLFIGVFRRGNKPPVLLGEDKKLKHMQIKPPEI